MQRALALTGKDRPNVCLVMTASGDEAAYLAATYSALWNSCQVDHLALFLNPIGLSTRRWDEQTWCGLAAEVWPISLLCGVCTESMRPCGMPGSEGSSWAGSVPVQSVGTSVARPTPLVRS